MKLFLTLLSISILCVTSRAQEETWTLYKSIDGVGVYYKQADCVTDVAPSQVAYIIRVENTNATDITIEWDLAVWYNYERQTLDVAEGENHQTLEVKSGSTVEGDCEVPYGALYVFKDFITYVSPTKLTRFELENLKVTQGN